MSIFKDSFAQGVRDQLNARQIAIGGNIFGTRERTPDAIQYFNSRNAWIRMTSAVEVGGDGGALARSYVLLGGTLSGGVFPKSGVGTGTANAYSTRSPGGRRNRLGIRPMPGITSIDVKSKAAYGSLREVTVNFQCWDIRQLEDLELLYMRPGYSVMVEWGWAPYLDNGGGLQSNVSYIDAVINGRGPKENIWRDIFAKASRDGNYDAVYGFVKNYSWSARPDGGYDCTTTIITMGEILESLKINYNEGNVERLQIDGVFNFATLRPPIPPPPWYITLLLFLGIGAGTALGIYLYNLIFGDRVTTLREAYSQNIIAGLCKELYDEVNIRTIGVDTQELTINSTVGNFGGNNDYHFIKHRLDISKQGNLSITDGTNQVYILLADFIKLLNRFVLVSQQQGNTRISNPIASLSVLDQNGAPLLCLGSDYQISTNPSVCIIRNPLWEAPDPNLHITGLNGLADTTIRPYMDAINAQGFTYYDPATEFGTIGNIYVNLDYIFRLATNEDLANEDKKEKNDIILFDFIKSMMAGINAAIGNVANFDLFIDPIESVGRIIDVNYVDAAPRNDAWRNSFLLPIHNTNSVVRSYKLESQIFPDQVTTIAIGSQTQGGALAENTNTLVDFNRNLRDRIVRDKNSPLTIQRTGLTAAERLNNLQETWGFIASFLIEAKPSFWESSGEYDIEQASRYSNALKDLIEYSNSYVRTDTNNRAIIPTKLSLEMDGIGGIRIGNVFRINEDILPRGYKGGNGPGPARIAFTVTGVGHSIQNNDWVTKIDAQFIILDNPNNNTRLLRKDQIPVVPATLPT